MLIMLTGQHRGYDSAMSDADREWMLRIEAKLDELLTAWRRLAPLVDRWTAARTARKVKRLG